MKTFKQFQEDIDKDMLGVYSTLGGVTALGVKAVQELGKKATSMNTANKKLNKRVSDTRRGT
tara:strand:+ start:313 stop:498 length:186 start_codon:yes stop_codon:yes gene_type:complete